MKKHILHFAMLLGTGAMLMTGCNKDDQQIFHLSVNDNHAKTSLGTGYTTLWQSGDEIYINTTPLSVTVSNNSAWTSNDVNIDPINGQFYAFYAGRGTFASADLNASSQSYSFSMPNSYTYDPAQLQSPMAGIGTYQGSNPYTSVDVTFENLFSLLELEVPAAPAGSSYTITIFDTDSINSEPLAGNFVASYGSDGWTTTASSNARYTLTVTKNTSETKIYVPIPAGQHKLDISFSALPGGATQIQAYSFKAGYYYQINTLPGTSAGGEVIPYPFPTDDGGYAFFGKGNMVYDVNHDPKWFLEPNQWDYTEFTASGNTATQSSSLSWMTSSNQHPENPNNGGTVHGDLYPQGYATLLNDSQHTTNWTVPTQAEWTNFLGLGTGATAKWAYLRINTGTTTVNGLFFTPSLTDMPETLEFGTTYSGGWTSVPTMTTTAFEALEARGCIFLPAYGYVVHQGNSGHLDASTSTEGFYRTATATQTSTASVLHFLPTAAPSFTELHRGDGVSVRLFYITGTSTSSSK